MKAKKKIVWQVLAVRNIRIPLRYFIIIYCIFWGRFSFFFFQPFYSLWYILHPQIIFEAIGIGRYMYCQCIYKRKSNWCNLKHLIKIFFDTSFIHPSMFLLKNNERTNERTKNVKNLIRISVCHFFTPKIKILEDESLHLIGEIFKRFNIIH